MAHNKLLDDVGFSGDGPAVESILKGEYVFPEGTDTYTELLMLEAAVLFSSLGEQGNIDHLVHSHDFQHFWLHVACERTESSKSQLHFGHYMAETLNRCRRYYCTHSLADIAWEIFTNAPGTSTNG